MKSNHSAGDAYALKLTQLQKISLLHSVRLKPSIQQAIEHSGAGTQTIRVTREDLDFLNAEVSQATVSARASLRNPLRVVLKKITALLEAADEIAAVAVPRSRSRLPAKNAGLLCQFKVTLLGIKPPIWRRIQVPDCTLEELHLYLQRGFGPG